MALVIETERLVLRAPVAEDFDAWAEFHGDVECMRYLGGAMPRSVAWRAMSEVVGMWPLRGFGQFSAIEKSTGKWVGRVGAWKPGEWPVLEVGWMLHRSAWGKGYATEAGEACLDYVFNTLGWASVAHLIHPENAGSHAVAARLGSRFLKMVRMPPPLDVVGETQMWGQSAEEWRARRR